MLTIDGSTGGGQVLRTSLTLSAMTHRAICIESIRGARDTPGLRPQHLACVDVLTTLTNASVTGGEVGSQTITFEPETAPTGSVEIDIGTAGSIPLLFETLVSLSPILEAPITVGATGGTDVRWAPSMDYLEQVKLPALIDHGFKVDMEVERRGYYPVGDGAATLTVHPSTPTSIELTEHASLDSVWILSRAAESLSSAEVVKRQVDGAKAAFEEASVPVDSVTATYHDVSSTGTSVTAVGRFTNGYGGGDSIGERGKPAEIVGAEAAEMLLAAADARGAVDRLLADQLMVPLAMTGGQIRAPEATEHLTSNAAVIQGFDVSFDLSRQSDDSVLMRTPGFLSGQSSQH